MKFTLRATICQIFWKCHTVSDAFSEADDKSEDLKTIYYYTGITRTFMHFRHKAAQYLLHCNNFFTAYRDINATLNHWRIAILQIELRCFLKEPFEHSKGIMFLN